MNVHNNGVKCYLYFPQKPDSRYCQWSCGEAGIYCPPLYIYKIWGNEGGRAVSRRKVNNRKDKLLRCDYCSYTDWCTWESCLSWLRIAGTGRDTGIWPTRSCAAGRTFCAGSGRVADEFLTWPALAPHLCDVRTLVCLALSTPLVEYHAGMFATEFWQLDLGSMHFSTELAALLNANAHITHRHIRTLPRRHGLTNHKPSQVLFALPRYTSLDILSLGLSLYI